jgi:hypothetical protein
MGPGMPTGTPCTLTSIATVVSMSGKTSRMRMRTVKALRRDVYSLDSRQWRNIACGQQGRHTQPSQSAAAGLIGPICVALQVKTPSKSAIGARFTAVTDLCIVVPFLDEPLVLVIRCPVGVYRGQTQAKPDVLLALTLVDLRAHVMSGISWQKHS